MSILLTFEHRIELSRSFVSRSSKVSEALEYGNQDSDEASSLDKGMYDCNDILREPPCAMR